MKSGTESCVKIKLNIGNTLCKLSMAIQKKFFLTTYFLIEKNHSNRCLFLRIIIIEAVRACLHIDMLYDHMQPALVTSTAVIPGGGLC